MDIVIEEQRPHPVELFLLSESECVVVLVECLPDVLETSFSGFASDLVECVSVAIELGSG